MLATLSVQRSGSRGSLAAVLLAGAVLAGGCIVGEGCGTDATGVDSCRQIEDARCRRAPACGISLQPPYSTSGSAVDACIRFYETACLHGLEVSDPGPLIVGQCVTAITDGGCSVVASPQTSPACAWLSPSPSATDASDAPTDALDAGTDSPE